MNTSSQTDAEFVPWESSGWPSQPYELKIPYAKMMPENNCVPTGPVYDTIINTMGFEEYEKRSSPPVQYVASERYSWTDDPSSDVNTSWNAVKKSGVVRMTPYSKGVRTINRFPIVSDASMQVETRAALAGNERIFDQCQDWRGVWLPDGAPPSVIIRQGIDLSITRSLPSPDMVQYGLCPVKIELSDLLSSVVKKHMSTYDLLTDLGELPQTLKLIISLLKSARKPLSEMKEFWFKHGSAISKSKDLSSMWLQFRYGIMPIYYSLQDAIKLLNLKGKFITTRGSMTVKGEFIPPPPDLDYYHFRDGEDIAEIRVTCKSGYSSESFLKYAQTGSNPFLTAWELIPYSLVVDWFVNVGDWIAAQTYGLKAPAVSEAFCYSIKRTKRVSCELVSKPRELYYLYPSYNYQDVHNWMFSEGQREALCYNPVEETVAIGGVFYREIEDSYNRVLFTPSDIGLTFNSSLNFLQSLDGIAMAIQKVASSLRRL